jgi:ATP-dependent Clp protease ATP-binding subunit ClpC
MFERFTDRARKVMALANQEAQRFNHEYIGTEHILLGLVKEGSGVGANVLKNLDIDLRKVRLEVEKLVKDGPPTVTMGKLPQTPRTKMVIEFAIEEARNLNHRYIGTEHKLLGLLRETDGVAAKVLMNLGVKLKEVREEVLNLLGAGEESSSEAASLPPSSAPTLYDLDVDTLIAILLNKFDSQITTFNKAKDEAVVRADYERAAQLREEILALHDSRGAAIKKILGIE